MPLGADGAGGGTHCPHHSTSVPRDLIAAAEKRETLNARNFWLVRPWICDKPIAPKMLYLVGLGLSDETDITVKGLEIVKKASRVYLEAYTSILLVDQTLLVRVAPPRQ